MRDTSREQSSLPAAAFEAAGDDGNPLEALWACLACYWKGMFQQMRHEGTIERPNVLCPVCGSDDVHQADGSILHVKAYFGEIGTRH